MATLVGGDPKKVDGLIAKYKDELQQSRTIKLGKATQAGTAEFFLLLGPGDAGTKVEGTKFISGDEKLRGLADGLRAGKYNFNFPDDVAVKILRRGVVSCSPVAGECLFVLMLPEDVRSVD